MGDRDPRRARGPKMQISPTSPSPINSSGGSRLLADSGHHSPADRRPIIAFRPHPPLCTAIS